MKKILTTLFFIFLHTLAFAVQIPIGYSKGQIAKSSTYIVNGKGVVGGASRISPELTAPYVGNEIRGLAVGIIDSRYCDSICVFVANSLNGIYLATGSITNKDADTSKRPTDGWNVIPLNKAVTIDEGQEIYIGFLFYQRYKCEALSFVGKDDMNHTYVKRGASGDWEDACDKGYLSLEMLIDGENMPQVDMSLDASKGIINKSDILTTTITVTNHGQSTPTNFDLTYTAEGYTYETTIDKAIAPTCSETFDVTINNLPVGVGLKSPITVSISRIEGGKDAIPSDNDRMLSMRAKRNVVVEEFTGTGCGWCPRGLVGMEKMRNLYGDRFVGVSIHQYNSSDPMYPDAYESLGFSGAPSCTVNRTTMTDPYYGTDSIDICHDFEAAMNEGALASIEVTGAYEENKNTVNATATITAMDNLSGLKLAFMLIADSLTGTTASWKQKNYYASNYSSSDLPEDLAKFGAGGELGQSSFFCVFNDVAIGTYYENGLFEVDLGYLDNGNSITINKKINMPTKNSLIDAIDYHNVAVIAILLDKDGSVINAHKYYLDGRSNDQQSDNPTHDTELVRINDIFYEIDHSTLEAKVTFNPENISYYAGDISIPEFFFFKGEKYMVNKIGNSAFHNCTQLASILIPNSVTIIESAAFYNCKNLSHIDIPNNVTSIGSAAFYGCSKLDSFTIPTSLTKISVSTFEDCKGLTSVTIPFNTTIIGNSAFRGCKDLLTIEIPNSVKSIGTSAFENCYNLSSISIGKSIETINNKAFNNCPNLTYITIDNNNILSKSYSSSFSLRHIFGTQVISYSLGEEVKSIGNDAFYGCEVLTSIILPQNLTKIGKSSFSGCKGLKAIDIPNKVESIEQQAFYGCTSLESITLGENVKTIGSSAFYRCLNLESITLSENLTIIRSTTFQGCAKLKSIIVPNKVESIERSAFLDCTSLESVILGENVRTIGEKAFFECSSLKSITLPNKVYDIGSSAFAYCSSLESATLGENLTIIRSRTFIECAKLKSIIVPNNVDSIERAAFNNCTSLESVTLSENLKTIGYGAFSNCSSLKYIEIPNNVIDIESDSFYGCSNLDSISFGVNISDIGSQAFYKCVNLSKVNIKDIGKWCEVVFHDYSSNPLCYAHNLYVNDEYIKNLIIPNGTEIIRKNAFINCLNLESISIPSSMKTIYNSFSGCKNLNKIFITDLSAWCKIDFNNYEANPLSVAHNLYLNDESIKDLIIPSDVISIENYSFYGCTGLSSVTIHANVSSLGASVFEGCNTSVFLLHQEQFSMGKDCFKTDHVYGFSCVIQEESGFSFLQYDNPIIKIYSNGIKLEGIELNNYDDEVVSYEFLGIDSEENPSYFCAENKNHILYYVIYTSKGHSIKGSYKFHTPPTELNTLSPKVVNEGEVVVGADTNLMDETPNCGFEWRKTDAPDVVQSKTGEAIIFEGKMEGIIKNIDASSFYKVRPYYQKEDKSKMFGSWIGFDPSDFSFFEPTVHTYYYVQIENGIAKLVGYVMQGSDDIIEQGFEYWPVYESNTNIFGVPNYEITKVTGSGQRMEVELKNLLSDTKYGYRAYVQTNKGTTYGEEYEFTMPKIRNYHPIHD